MTERWQEQQPLEQMDKMPEKDAALARQHRRRKRITSTILAWLLVVVVSLVLVTVVGGTVFILSGKFKLLSRTRGEAPDLALKATSDVQADDEEESSYVWKEGWIRYDDKVYEYNDDIMTFLVMGIDKRTTVEAAEDATDGGQADGLYLLVANQDEKNVKIIAINRDTMVDIYMYGFEENGITPKMKGQITLQHGFGDGLEKSCEATVDAVSNLFYDLPISGYVAINVAAVGDLVEVVDGVDIELQEDMTMLHPDWTKGASIHLTGYEAYEYVHYRDITVFESARQRVVRQKQFLTVFIDKMRARVKEDITLPVRLYNQLNKYMVTDITADEVAYLATQMIDYDFDGENIYTMEGTTVMGELFEEFYPDYDALKEMMIQVFYREVDLK